MNTYKYLQSLGLAVLVSLALGGQSVDGRDKKDDKTDGANSSGRGHSSAPARVSSSSHGKQQHVGPSSSRGSSYVQRQGKSSGGPSVHQRSAVAQSSHQNTPKNLAGNSHSRGGIDRQRGYASARALNETVPEHIVTQRSHPDRIRVENRHGPQVIDHGSNRGHALAQNDRSPRVIDHGSIRGHALAQNDRGSRVFDSGSRRGHDWAHHSTWYRSAGDYHLGVWRDDPAWCPDRSWAWHHQHRFFWNGIWVIGDYPSFGYDPGVYTYDPQPLYPVGSTGLAVQSALAEQGYYDGPIDGVVGEGTRGAIADYQNDHNLPVTGLIDDELLSALGIT